MPATLFTIGYQGTKLEQVVASLAAARVSVLVDTRETPTSRRVEFGNSRPPAMIRGSRSRPQDHPHDGLPDRAVTLVIWNLHANVPRCRLSVIR